MNRHVKRTIRQTLTIARRDFVATVFTPIFLLFLFAPVIMGSFGAIGGMGAASVGGAASDKTRIVAIVAHSATRTIAETDTRFRAAFRRPEDEPPKLMTLDPERDPRRTGARYVFEQGI